VTYNPPPGDFDEEEFRRDKRVIAAAKQMDPANRPVEGDGPDFAVVACIPVDRGELDRFARETGVRAPRPTDLYKITSCELCGQGVWIGPRQQMACIIRPSLRKLCYFCAIDEMARLEIDVPLTSLGGGEGVEGVVRG
jgi:hypothetical protein